MKEASLILKQPDMPLLLQGKISASIDKGLTKIIQRSSPDQFKVSDRIYIKNNATSTWEPKWESGFHLIAFLTPCSAILDSTLNENTRRVNTGDMQLADPTMVIEAEDIPPNRWSRKAKLLFNEESLLDLNWQKC